jgi:uncharacterized surface protein with fasciclin (FAS1) repeats
MYKKYLTLALALSLTAISASFAVVKEVGEGIDAVGRGVGKGVSTVGRGVSKGVRKLPVVGDLLGGESGVVIGGAQVNPAKNIVENLSASRTNTKLVSAVKSANLVEPLSNLQNGPYTIFAPTDEAFNKLPADKTSALMQPEGQKDLTNVLTYHVVPGVITSRYLRDGQTLTTLNGEKLKVTLQNGSYYINGAKILTPNAVSSNGVIHVVDSVIMP